MMDTGYKIELRARYKHLQMYNIYMEVGLFDSEGEQIGFLKEVQKWEDTLPSDSFRKTIQIEPCHHAIIYLFIVPKSVPEQSEIHAPKDFSLKITGYCGNERILVKDLKVNEWAGTNLEIELKRN